jgi:protein-tyrosine kinase
MSLIEKAVERLESMQRQSDRAVDGAAQLPVASAPAGGSAHRMEDRSRAQTESQSDSPRLAVNIDFAGLAKRGMLDPGAPQTLLAQEVRVLKRPLLNNVVAPVTPVRNANLIMVTSALPGEGKTFTAVNLAISIAMELERTVLLVDADVARPSLPSVLGIEGKLGLLDVLQGESTRLSDVLLHTNMATLRLLTAGTRNVHATELLASDAMGRLLDEMARRYPDRIIVFDSPPLLVTTEARTLASRVGQVVYVVKAEETPKKAIMDALATIESCPVRLMVLNQAYNFGRIANGYGYGYGY